jgi:hypothetical protein
LTPDYHLQLLTDKGIYLAIVVNESPKDRQPIYYLKKLMRKKESEPEDLNPESERDENYEP